MNVRNCKKCGKLFNYAMGMVICPACKEALDEKFKEVKTYIQGHPGVGIHQVSEECDVEVAQIQQWLREERLEFTADSVINLTCEACGTTIRSGRYCDKCKAAVVNGLKSIARTQAAPTETPKKDSRDVARMRFLN